MLAKEETLRRLARMGSPISHIAKKTGLTQKSVREMAQRIGVELEDVDENTEDFRRTTISKIEMDMTRSTHHSVNPRRRGGMR